MSHLYVRRAQEGRETMAKKRDTSTLTEEQGTMKELLNKEAGDKALAIPQEADVLTIDDFKIMDQRMISEALSMVGDMYEPEVCYNIPRATGKGKTSWEACKRMPFGVCKYEKEGTKHIHNVDVGIHGARIAAQAYGGLDYRPLDRPMLVEEGGKFYWVVEVQCVDEIRNLSVTHWQFQPLIIKGPGGSYVEIEHGAAIVQSKGLRKVILSVIPPQLRRIWIKDFLAGKDAFDPEKVLALPGGRRGMIEEGDRKPPSQKEAKKEKAPEPEKPKEEKAIPPVTNSGASDLQSIIAAMAPHLDTTVERLTEFSTTYKTMAQAMLELTRANGDEGTLAQVKEKFNKWSDQHPETPDED